MVLRFHNIMQRIGAIFLFYKPYVLWSFGINIILLIINPSIAAAIVTKLLLIAVLWYVLTETHARRKLIFYKNLGISSLKLFSTIFLIDIFITLVFMILIKEFI